VYEIIAAVTNLTALAVIGFIYTAYIKNLRAVNKLKDAQLKIAEQNVKLWKDKVLELERRTPEFIEKQLGERIKIREDEISRLARDSESHKEQIQLKNREIEALSDSIIKATEYRNSITVWDREEGDFVDVSHSDIEQKHIGSICVDTASIMICDPWYPKMRDDREKEEFQVKSLKFKVKTTGEYFCSNSKEDGFPAEVLGLEDQEELSVDDLLQKGIIEQVDYEGELPAIDQSYIKREHWTEYKAIRHLSFVNGGLGAGISVSLGADGVYSVYAEYYKNEMQRIIINV